MKTFDRKDVYSWSNADEAKTYIGKTGYFNNDFESIKRAIELGGPAVLDRVDTNSIWCFKALGVSLCFGLFLPANKVKEVEEKKWRAFKDIGEFQCVTNKFIGDIIEVKSDWDGRAYRCLIMWATEGYIGMASLRFSLLIDLFEHYQWKDSNNEWKPFGVEE